MFHFRLLFLIFLFASFSPAADAPSLLTVGELGAYLYARQDESAEKIVKLENEEHLTPLAYAAGTAAWYMVRTQKGAVGWVKSSDVKAGDQVRKEFTELHAATWSARASAGRVFSGTWTGAVDPATGTASGTWTLIDVAGKTVLDGTWSANKSPKGWSGTWRALRADFKGVYSGTWRANVRLSSNAAFADLFEAALRDVVGGNWKAGPNAGTWSIRGLG